MNRKREAYDRLAVGDRIRKKRVQLGFSQDEVAERLCDPAFEIIYCSYADFPESVIILFLTVSKNKIAAMPENIGVVAILTVVLNYSILFPSFTFFLDGFHLAFGDKFEICIKTTDLM